MALPSEGHEMNRARGPSGVCPGDMCDWVRQKAECAGGAGSIEPAEEMREKRRIRPINSAIVANQDHPERGGSLDLH